MRLFVYAAAVLVFACGDNITIDDEEEVPDDIPAVIAGPMRVSTPTLTVVGRTATTISFRACAGPSGLPAGFSVEWMAAEAFDGWPPMFDASVCYATFDGLVESRFPLAPGACTTIDIGRLFDEEPGVSFVCDELVCATPYVFRAYGNGTLNLGASEPTGDVYADTLACERERINCTYTQGYWKNHLEAWPVDELALGDRRYTKAELVAIFRQPARGNGLVALAHQLAAAKLGIAQGADDTAIAATVEAATLRIGLRVIPPIGDGYLAPRDTSALVEMLARFNEGKIGPGHCECD
jgi:hypothetical protein